MGPFARGSRFPKTLRGEETVNPKNFFAELKRRNVYKVAVAYAIVSWLLLQAASICVLSPAASLCIVRNA
jgi:hypothetical protein